ncbi:uncharacterized protein LOC134679350 [Cydia fagiglandana]|uniref:uncharacterized protein LOC134679350 n=1 Tax=Cydia fagiglandana TaxID=1458189 RepID=UPI002FEDF1FA
MWLILYIVFSIGINQGHGENEKKNSSRVVSHAFTVSPDEIVPMLPDEGMQISTVIAGLMPDSFGEMFNFLDGDSFGIGPMHEFVYGWQAIVNTMSMKNNVEVRKRAGMQRFALAGINGITLISHIGVTEIMINGTRTYCFGGVSRPPGRRSVICKGAMYQEGRFTCKVPYLRFPTVTGYKYCIDKYAAVKSMDGTYKKTYCARGDVVPKFHYDYICERREIRIKKINMSDPNERFNIRNPVVRRAEYYRAPYDILKACPDWYGCNLRISPELASAELPPALLQANDTEFIAHGGKYWLALYYTQLSTYAIYFQAHAEYPWQSNRPVVPADKGGIWEQLLKANIGPDMNLHYNLNGIFNRFPNYPAAMDLLKNDGQVQPANFRSPVASTGEEIISSPHVAEGPGGDMSATGNNYFRRDSQGQPPFDQG